jgi:hypothetical protein
MRCDGVNFDYDAPVAVWRQDLPPTPVVCNLPLSAMTAMTALSALSQFSPDEGVGRGLNGLDRAVAVDCTASG